MNRAALTQLFADCNGDKSLARQRLNEYYDTPEGQEDIANAPSSISYDTNGKPVEKTKDLIIELLLTEFT